MLKSREERAAAAENKAAKRAPSALANLQGRRLAIVRMIAAPKLGLAGTDKNIDELAERLFYIDRAIESLQRDGD
jgi:hypothetical protein